MFHARTLFGTVLVGTLALAMSSAQASIKVDVRWSVVEHEISPLDAYHTSSAGKTFWMENGRVVTRDHNLQAATTFGQQALMTNRSGNQYLSGYSIRGGRVIGVNRFPGNIETVSVETNGQACSASVRYTPVRGQRYITGRRVSNGDAMVIAEKHAENVVCRISNE